MKIKRVKIQSFGTIQGETQVLDPKLNVVYGPNEAGKSTLRSFITTTLFPKSGLKYPAQKKSDNGSVEVELSDGNQIVYTKDGKGSDSNAPELCGIDDKEYISIYSMSPADLRDMKAIEKGGIRNRFLTIPGGTDLPNAYDSLNEERLELLPEKRRSSSCRTAKLMDAAYHAKANANYYKNRESGDAHYAELVSERDRLTECIDKQTIEVQNRDRVRTDSHKADAHADNLKKIEAYRKKEKDLLYSENIDENALTILQNEVNSSKKIAEKAHEKADRLLPELGGFDYKKILNRKKEIDYIDKNSLTYEREKAAMRRSQSQPQPKPKPQSRPVEPKPVSVSVSTKGGIPILAVIGLIVAVLGIALLALVNVVGGLLVTVVGAVLAAFGFMKGRNMTNFAPIPSSTSTPVLEPEPEPVSEPFEEYKSELVEYVDNTLREIIADIGMKSKGFQADLQKLTGLVASAEKYQEALGAASAADTDLKNAKDKVESFFAGFGGKEKYDQAVKDKEELNNTRISLKALEDSVKDAPVVEIDSTTAENDYNAANKLLIEMNRDLGTVKQAINGIMEDTEVENAITVWNDAESAVYDAVLRWASLTLEKIILDKASNEAYENHRPDVLLKADGFLDLMTCGRYRMSTDPRETDIAVIDAKTGDSKTCSEWSSGLEDQVKLALKLAVSLSLSKEKPPVILDDILLTSDSERKKGACEAISSLSEDIQVLYFTCDKETRDVMEKLGGNIIDL